MRPAQFLAVLLLGLPSLGCAMCDGAFDCDYAAFGGVHDRIDRRNGRVGSLFDPAAALESNLPTEMYDDSSYDEESATDLLPSVDAPNGQDEPVDDEGFDPGDLPRQIQETLEKARQLPQVNPEDET